MTTIILINNVLNNSGLIARINNVNKWKIKCNEKYGQ